LGAEPLKRRYRWQQTRPAVCGGTRYSGEYAALHHRAGLLAPLLAERKPGNAAATGICTN
jgi:hypothetical protein